MFLFDFSIDNFFSHHSSRRAPPPKNIYVLRRRLCLFFVSSHKQKKIQIRVQTFFFLPKTHKQLNDDTHTLSIQRMHINTRWDVVFSAMIEKMWKNVLQSNDKIVALSLHYAKKKIQGDFKSEWIFVFWLIW